MLILNDAAAATDDEAVYRLVWTDRDGLFRHTGLLFAYPRITHRVCNVCGGSVLATAPYVATFVADAIDENGEKWGDVETEQPVCATCGPRLQENRNVVAVGELVSGDDLPF